MITNQIIEQISRSSNDVALPSSSSSRWMAPRHSCSSVGVSWMPIQPDRSYLAMRLAERFGSLRPLKKIGGCGSCNGLAPKPQLSKSANSPWYSNSSFVQMPFMISIVSRTCWCRLGKMCAALDAANSSGIHPEPTPTLIRPLHRWSTVAISAASTPGARYGVSVMLIPMRTFDVFAASHGISGQPWNHSPRADTGSALGNSLIIPNEYCSSWRSDASGTTMRSSVHTESKSSSSASAVSSSSSLIVTLSRKFGRYRASFMGGGLLRVRRVVRAQLVAQFPLDDLAVVVGRQGVDEAVLLGPLVAGDRVEARRSSSFVAGAASPPATTKATTASPHSASGRPTTAAAATPGWRSSASSTSRG